MYQFFELILAMGLAWSISGVVRQTLHKNRTTNNYRYTIIVIVVFIFIILDNLLRPNHIPMRILKYIYPLTRTSYFLVGPVLFMYVQMLIKPSRKINYMCLMHLSPFILWFCYVLINPEILHPPVIFEENALIREPTFASRWLKLDFYWDLTVNVSRLFYSIAIFMAITSYRKKLPENVSNINRWNTLSWIKVLVLFYTGIYILNSVVSLMFNPGSSLFQISAATVRIFPPILFVFIFSIYSEEQPILVDSNLELSEKKNSSGKKYKKSGLTEKESQALFSTLSIYMEKTNAYRNPELNINDLATEMGETRHRLSEALNKESGNKFYGYINRLRLRDFKKAIEENSFPNYTIIAIAMECGFGSSSAFYSLFKKEFGIPPKEYVKSVNVSAF